MKLVNKINTFLNKQQTTRNKKQETRNFLKPWLLLVLILLSVTEFYSQGLPPGTYSSQNKKAIKYFEESQALFKIRKDDEAEKAVLKAIKEDDNFIEAHSGYG